jgi:predicted permease
MAIDVLGRERTCDLMESVLRDLRLAARGLRRNPGFTAVAVLTLALGIGATTAVFSVVYGVLFRPLPFPNADRLVEIVQTLHPEAQSDEGHRVGLSPDQFANLQEHATTLEAVGAYGHAPRTLTGIPIPVRLTGAGVSTGFLGGLGVPPLLGRTFEDDDAAPGADPVVVLAEGTWRRYFAGDENIIGRRIVLDEVQTRVVGVMPASYRFPSLAGPGVTRDSVGDLEEVPEFWLPSRLFTRTGPSQGYTALKALALLQPGVSLEQATTEVRLLAGPLPNNQQLPIELTSARDEMARPARQVLLIFQIGVTLILLIASVNVINLLLTRAAGRRRETAIRVALGASRTRIIREGTAEALLLALAGGALGCVLAYLCVSALQSLPPHILPRIRDIRVDETVLIVALLTSLATGLLVGLLSARRTGRAVLSHELHKRGGLGASPHRRLRPSSLLVVVEIAAAMVLLTGSGLLVNSFVRLVTVDVGYEPTGVLTFRVDLPRNRYATMAARARFVESLSSELRSLPDVESVAATGQEGIGFYPLFIDGQPAPKGEARYRRVTPDYFRTLQLPVLQGQEFRRDSVQPASGVIVNESFARRYLTGGAAIGRRIRWADWVGVPEIVAVVADSKRTFDSREEPMLYLPHDGEDGLNGLTMLVRTSSQSRIAQVARETISRLDPQLAAYDFASLLEELEHHSAPTRFYSLLSLACAGVALLLAAIGLYGVLSYSVGARTNEFGIRLALGANAPALMRGVVRQGLTLTTFGLAIGLAGSYLASQSLASLLFGVDPHDAPTFVGVAAVFVFTSGLACYLPSRRATRVDPATALRSE